MVKEGEGVECDLSAIDLNLKEKLQDKEYRQRFWRAIDAAGIAQQLIALRKLRGLSQAQVAEMIGTKQPAISRVERADCPKNRLETLRSIVEALDGRMRIIIEPSEGSIKEFDSI